MKFLWNMFEKMGRDFQPGGKLEKLWPLFEAQQTFLFILPKPTKAGAHVRDSMDMKRLMSIVILALFPCLFFGMYNVGYQHFMALGSLGQKSVLDCMVVGARYVIPIVMVSYIAGGLWEVLFCVIRKHEINEGFLVTGMLLPLTLPPDIPLWKVAVGISFGVVIGKEVFGGTGMNIFNPALTARAFLFFAYAQDMSGDMVWVAGAKKMAGQFVDGWSGATPLAQAAAHSGSATAAKVPIVQAVETFANGAYTWKNMFIGLIPGSIGETSTLLCLVGAIVLIAAGVASWRIMAGVLIGTFGVAGIFNLLAPTPGSYLALPFTYHLVMGGYAFGLVYMATDPVSAAQTKLGKWLYGMLIGAVVLVIRVLNPAYPEGMMLSILLGNVFAPLIDYAVLQAHIKRRMSRVAVA